MRFIEKMQDRWGVGLWGVIAILLAFSLAGSTVVKIRTPVLRLVLPDDTPRWARTAVYILLIVPLYQICLLAYGTLLGQFRFFWRKEKQLGRWLLRILSLGAYSGTKK